MVKKYERKDLKSIGFDNLDIGSSKDLDELLNDFSEWLANCLTNDILNGKIVGQERASV